MPKSGGLRTKHIVNVYELHKLIHMKLLYIHNRFVEIDYIDIKWYQYYTVSYLKYLEMIETKEPMCLVRDSETMCSIG